MADFKRTLTLTTTITIVAGGIIGSGIFMKPALMASQLGSPALLLSVWVVAGIITLFGALSNAEVAAMFPETGGQYVFFKKMYGNTFAFVYGWAAFAVFNTAALASLAFIFAQYASFFIQLPHFNSALEQSFYFHIPFIGDIHPLENFGIKSLAIILVFFFTIVNYYSSKIGSDLQRAITFLKIASLALLILGILFSGKGSFQNFLINADVKPQSGALFLAYISALGAAFWAYDGWNNITFVAGEIKEPQQNIPRGLFIGVLIIITIYCTANIAYIYALPINKMAASNFVASDAATATWGIIGGSIIALMVMLSTLGTTCGNIFAYGRVTFAMRTESKLFSWAGKMQPNYHTPGNALILNAVWTIILIISGSFDMLTDMLIFVTWFFYGSSALGVILLRYKMKNAERPYKVWGYPFVTFFFVLFTVFFLCFTLYKDVSNYTAGKSTLINSLLGTVITLIGIPVYYFSKRKK